MANYGDEFITGDELDIWADDQVPITQILVSDFGLILLQLFFLSAVLICDSRAPQATLRAHFHLKIKFLRSDSEKLVRVATVIRLDTQYVIVQNVVEQVLMRKNHV